MILAEQGSDTEMTALATEIKGAQTPEIDQLTGWLTGPAQSATPSTSMGHDMGGTVSPADVDVPDTATGEAAATLFLTGMITHQKGAIDMARSANAG